VPFSQAAADGRVVFCQDEIDPAYIRAVQAQGFAGPRSLKIIYSPLHGVGASAVVPALAADGFDDVEVFGPHATANGDFPNVPGHVANPENSAVFDDIVAGGRPIGAELALASDPDCDRIGLSAPRSSATSSAWATMTGNQIGALLTEYLLDHWKRAGRLTPEHYVVKTLVTTELVRRIADAYGARTIGNLQVGFKYIGGTIDAVGPDKFVFGAEESHGYLAGTYARDKDAAVAAMLLAELAAEVKVAGLTLHDKLDALYWQYGYHAESQISVVMPGSEGMQRMAALMARFRLDPPMELAGLQVRRVRDYLNLVEHEPGNLPRPFQGPMGDMVMLDLEADGAYVAVRPSGTEPKVKYYMFTYEPAEQLADLEETKVKHAERLAAIARELIVFSSS